MSYRRTADFLLHDWLNVAALQQRARFAEHNRETFDAVLDMCEKLAAEKFAPFNRLADTEEPWFDGEKVHLPAASHAAALCSSTSAPATVSDAEGSVTEPAAGPTAGLAAAAGAAGLAAGAFRRGVPAHRARGGGARRGNPAGGRWGGHHRAAAACPHRPHGCRAGAD